MVLRGKFISKWVILNLYLRCFVTGGQVEYKNPTGKLTIVNLAMAGMGTKRIGIASLPPDIPNDTLRTSLAPFGKILYIQTKMWSKAYRYTVSNGIRLTGTQYQTV